MSVSQVQVAKQVTVDADSLKLLRFERGMRQADVALKAHVNKKTIEHMESGKPIRPTTLKKVADALAVDISVLIHGGKPSRLDGHATKKELHALRYWGRAEKLREEERYELALFYYETVRELVPEGELADDALVGIAKTYRRLSQWDKALETLELILAKPDKGSYPRAYYNRACYLLLSNAPKQSVLDSLRKATDMEPVPGDYRKFALKDKDFETMWGDRDFIETLNPRKTRKRSK